MTQTKTTKIREDKNFVLSHLDIKQPKRWRGKSYAAENGTLQLLDGIFQLEKIQSIVPVFVKKQ